jgi:hypothetical protein
MNAGRIPDRVIPDPSAAALRRLIDRFDPAVFDVGRPRVRIRVEHGDVTTS